jgi:hypothetical protein
LWTVSTRDQARHDSNIHCYPSSVSTPEGIISVPQERDLPTRTADEKSERQQSLVPIGSDYTYTGIFHARSACPESLRTTGVPNDGDLASMKQFSRSGLQSNARKPGKRNNEDVRCGDLRLLTKVFKCLTARPQTELGRTLLRCVRCHKGQNKVLGVADLSKCKFALLTTHQCYTDDSEDIACSPCKKSGLLCVIDRLLPTSKQVPRHVKIDSVFSLNPGEPVLPAIFVELGHSCDGPKMKVSLVSGRSAVQGTGEHHHCLGGINPSGEFVPFADNKFLSEQISEYVSCWSAIRRPEVPIESYARELMVSLVAVGISCVILTTTG